jgi:hypothetical protein
MKMGVPKNMRPVVKRPGVEVKIASCLDVQFTVGASGRLTVR